MKLPSDIRFAEEKIKEAFYKLEEGMILKGNYLSLSIKH